MASYDIIAPYYDFLKRLVFGKRLDKATIAHFSHLKPSDRVLILGGGTGELIESLPKLGSVVYLDIASKMIEKARKRSSVNAIRFVHEDFLKYRADSTFDVIICPFFLDNFSNVELDLAIKQLKLLLKPKGKLFVADFTVGKGVFWDILIRAMHLFFRKAAGISSKKIKNIHYRLEKAGFHEKECVFFRRKKIFSRIYIYLETLVIF